MKNTFGQSTPITLFGESHGDAIGIVIDGLTPGINIDRDFIASQLDKRRPYGKISTGRQEPDKYQIVSGVFNNKTTGTPLCILIPNTSAHSTDYEDTKNIMRPSHADYTAQCKYHGFQDYRGGGHFSGRITAALVAGGAIAISALRKKGILIGTHISRCAGISDRNFKDLHNDITELNSMDFAVLDHSKAQEMTNSIEEAAKCGDSVGGILETAVIGLPSGLGEPWFDSFESILSHGLFSVPAVKGVEFGLGFSFADLKGSEANDSFAMENNRVITTTNNNGGINGGITNGMPVTFRCVVKPTPSIYKEQQTVDLETGKNTVLQIKGRHDPAIVHRARVVVDSITAFAVLDMLSSRFGTDFLKGEN